MLGDSQFVGTIRHMDNILAPNFGTTSSKTRSMEWKNERPTLIKHLILSLKDYIKNIDNMELLTLKEKKWISITNNVGSRFSHYKIYKY